MLQIKKMIFVVLSLCCVNAFAQEIFYVFTDKNGNTIMQDTLPPEYINKGYRIVNASGVTIKIVAPNTLSGQGGGKRSRQDDLQEQDLVLLQTYASVSEIEEIREKRVASVEDIIKLTQTHNEAFLRNLTSLFELQGSLRKNGEDVSDKLKQDIADVQQHIETNNIYIQKKRDEQRRLRDKFNGDINRFKVLQARVGTP